MTEADQQTTDYSGTAEFEPPNQSPGEKFILFEAAGRACCVPADSVLEVVHSLAVSAIPNSPSWLLGLSIFRGEPVAMVQPQAVIAGAGKHEAARNYKTIIFRSRSDEAQLALPVDRINEMINFAASDKPQSGPHQRDEVLRNGIPVLFLDPYEFIETLQKEGR